MMPSMNSLLEVGLVKEMAAPAADHTNRRRIDPETGKALVALGRAIEYLADEFVYEAGQHKPNRGQLDAIHILMVINRDLYLACPEIQPFRQWLRSLLHIRASEAVQSSSFGSKLSHGRL